jgi:hypothetical protein
MPWAADILSAPFRTNVAAEIWFVSQRLLFLVIASASCWGRRGVWLCLTACLFPRAPFAAREWIRSFLNLLSEQVGVVRGVFIYQRGRTWLYHRFDMDFVVLVGRNHCATADPQKPHHKWRATKVKRQGHRPYKSESFGAFRLKSTQSLFEYVSTVL